MTYRGRVKNGVVVPEAGAELPEGAEVRIDFSVEVEAAAVEEGSSDLPSLAERMEKVVGIAKGLPADFAINHDHYLHGQPKRQ
jgi:hypothetical protein